MKPGQQVWVLIENYALLPSNKTAPIWYSIHPGVYLSRGPQLKGTRDVLAIRFEEREQPGFFSDRNVFLSRQDAEAAAALRVLK